MTLKAIFPHGWTATTSTALAGASDLEHVREEGLRVHPARGPDEPARHHLHARRRGVQRLADALEHRRVLAGARSWCPAVRRVGLVPHLPVERPQSRGSGRGAAPGRPRPQGPGRPVALPASLAKAANAALPTVVLGWIWGRLAAHRREPCRTGRMRT